MTSLIPTIGSPTNNIHVGRYQPTQFEKKDKQQGLYIPKPVDDSHMVTTLNHEVHPMNIGNPLFIARTQPNMAPTPRPEPTTGHMIANSLSTIENSISQAAIGAGVFTIGTGLPAVAAIGLGSLGLALSPFINKGLHSVFG